MGAEEPDGAQDEQQPAYQDIARSAEPEAVAQARPERQQAQEFAGRNRKPVLPQVGV